MTQINPLGLVTMALCMVRVYVCTCVCVSCVCEGDSVVEDRVSFAGSLVVPCPIE